jgi:GNAT superfamily N-acetyltransferase
MITFRPACANDLAQAFEVFYENEVRDEPAPPSLPEDGPTTLAHILRTGTMYVAEDNGRILAFASAITRDGVTFLTDLFVRPDQQSSRLGQRLLHYVMPSSADAVYCTMGSTDPRALALYIRSGMQPQWPNFCLRLDEPMPDEKWLTNLTIIEADAGDPALVEWDARVSGRRRPQDHAYWVNEQQARPLWFQQDGATIGYGYVRLGAGTLWFPDACTLGPIGARTPTAALTCVLAAVGWAHQRAKILLIDVPGPHPCLVPLLEAHFRITYVETYVSSSPMPFFDPRCFIASGSDLF